MRNRWVKAALFFFLPCAISISQAQNVSFVTHGIIEYEKTVNLYSIFTRMATTPVAMQMVDTYKKTTPQFLTMSSKLAFTGTKTLFEPMAYSGPPNPFISLPMIEQFNVIYSDYPNKKTVTSKNVLGNTFLIKDSLKSISWKFTNETREILGFPCRRANGLIMDSIYVVAFYTDDIPVSGGPETFHGLPGMILQVVLPHENVSWKASKITLDANPAFNNLPDRGKEINLKELRNLLDGNLKRYGSLMQLYLKALLL